MGGLISRAALALPGTRHVERVVLLGTPNRGSYAPVQALRGTYAVIRKVARLDGDLDDIVTPSVAAALHAKLHNDKK